MIKRLLQLSALTTTIIILASAIIPHHEANSAAQAEPACFTGQLHEGMTMSDVQHSLGNQGNIWRVERSHSHDRGDPLAWNVEWRISCIYVGNTTDPDQVASFVAWAKEGSDERPPNSAFRLMEWKDVG